MTEYTERYIKSEKEERLYMKKIVFLTAGLLAALSPTLPVMAGMIPLKGLSMILISDGGSGAHCQRGRRAGSDKEPFSRTGEKVHL